MTKFITMSLIGLTSIILANNIKQDIVVTPNLTATYVSYKVDSNISYFYIENEELSEWVITKGFFNPDKDRLIIPLEDLKNPCSNKETKFRLLDEGITFCDSDKEIYHESNINVTVPLYNISYNPDSLFFESGKTLQ